MIEKIIREAFKKAEKECVSKAKNALAKHIAEEIEKRFTYVINERTLVRAYDKYVLSNEEDDSPPSQETVNAFCIYLGYENYKDYVNANNKVGIDKQQVIAEIENEFLPVKKRRSKWFLSGALVVIIGILGLLLFMVSGIGDNVDTIANQCLYWEVDRYRPIDCNKVLPQAIAKTKVAFSEALYTNFRKVSNAELINYSSVLWQGASPTGEMDYFATDGVHPLTQKKLVKVERETLKNTVQKEKTEIVEHAKPKKNSVSTIGTLIFENKKLDTSSGLKQNELSRSITANGIGFSEEEAKTNALKKIKHQ